jgi:hypothetical protein
LKGEPEYIKGKIFEGVNYTRNIWAKGILIQIYDLTKDMISPAYWEYRNQTTFGDKDVPAGYEIRVVGATISFI